MNFDEDRPCILMSYETRPETEPASPSAAGYSTAQEDEEQATRHNAAAAKHHEEAVSHYENGDHAKAVESAGKAHEHDSLAAKHKRQDRKKKK